MLKFFPGIRAR